ncbi:hypothetical protein [Yoonia sp. BS5-3]|uniref:Uncharacterized protein n=1 Tax=Yoonia phaeophyticola TaxID=3137369 RepID=A0ABZ2V7Y0_9RHOB
MSPLVIQIFIFMLVTFSLGIALGWLIWRFDQDAGQSADTVNTEIDFWRSNLEQCRFERDNEQKQLAAAHEEKNLLKRRIASLEQKIQAQAQAQAKS